MPNAVVRISVGSSPIDVAGGFGIPHRAHRIAPDAAAEPRKSNGRQHSERDGQIRDALLADVDAEQTRTGYAGQPVPAAGHALPLRSALLDDKAERDGHHSEVGTAHP